MLYLEFRHPNNGDVIGYVTVCKHSDDPAVGWLWALQTNKPYRGRGWGYKFMDFIVSKVAQAGFESIGLDCYDSNTVALHYYKKCGFQIVANPAECAYITFKLNIDEYKTSGAISKDGPSCSTLQNHAC